VNGCASGSVGRVQSTDAHGLGDGAVHHRHVEDAAQRLERVLDRRTKTAQHINCGRDAPPNSRDRRITRVRYGAIGSFGRAAGTTTDGVR
jgi:hypothetical protein